MKKQFKAFWLALVGVVWLLLMAVACHKTPEPEPNPEPDLPSITQTGAGPIGCYINGKPWVPKPYIYIIGPKYFSVSYRLWDNGSFYLAAYRDRSSIKLHFYNAKLGDNMLTLDNINEYVDFDYPNGCVIFQVDTMSVRNLVLTKLDTSKHIFSGTFEFTACNKCGDTLRFTKGRFDA